MNRSEYRPVSEHEALVPFQSRNEGLVAMPPLEVEIPAHEDLDLGRLSPQQKQELTLIVYGMLQSKGIKPEDPRYNDVVDTSADIVESTFLRGVKARKSTTLNPDESAASYFNTGLAEQEKIVRQAGLHVTQNEAYGTLTDHEIALLENKSPFRSDIDKVQRIITENRTRKQVVQTFHKALFDESVLKEPAALKRKDTYFTVEDTGGKIESLLRAFTTDKALLGNLIVNLLLYKQPELDIALGDVVELLNRWEDPKIREKHHTEIQEIMTDLAERMELDPQTISIYVKNVLSDMVALTQYPGPTPENILGKTIFHFPSSIVYENDAEDASETKEPQVYVVDAEEVVKAKKQVRILKTAFRRIDTFLNNITDEEENDPNSEYNTYYARYERYLKKFGPLDVFFAYRDGVFLDPSKSSQAGEESYVDVGGRIDEEMETYLSIRTMLETFEMLEADRYIMLDGDEEKTVPELEDAHMKEAVYNRLMKFMKYKLEDARLSDERFVKVIHASPARIVQEYLRTNDIAELSPTRKEALLSFSEEEWVAHLRKLHVLKVKNDVGEFVFLFPPGLSSLEELVRSMPEEKQTTILTNLR